MRIKSILEQTDLLQSRPYRKKVSKSLIWRPFCFKQLIQLVRFHHNSIIKAALCVTLR